MIDKTVEDTGQHSAPIMVEGHNNPDTGDKVLEVQPEAPVVEPVAESIVDMVAAQAVEVAEVAEVQAGLIDDSVMAALDEVDDLDSGDGGEPVAEVNQIQNTWQDYDVYVKLPTDPVKLAAMESIILPAGTIEELKAAQNNDLAGIEKTENGRKWLGALAGSIETVMPRNIFDRTTKRAEAEWRQSIRSEKGELTAAVPNVKFEQGEILSGKRALARVRGVLGLGSQLIIPLWHSGFWIRVEAPAEMEQLELQRRIIMEKINLGRSTHGLIFSNNSSYIINWLMDFALAHVTEHSISLKNGDIDLRKEINVLDIPTIIWGLACVIWPSGFRYTRSCISDPTKCNHVAEDKVNLNKLHWADQKALTARQIAHMTKRGTGTMTLDEVKLYRSEFVLGQGRSIQLTPHISMTMKIPTVDEYVNSGYRWVNNIVDMIDRTLAGDRSDVDRNVHITTMGRSSAMRQYAHWIESFDVMGNPILDTETIEETLDTLSPDDEVRKTYFAEVVRYIDDVTIGLIAVPTYECPNCHKVQPTRSTRFPSLLAIDVVSTFFTLLVEKLQRVNTREN